MKNNFELIKLKKIANKSYPKNGNRIGAVLICEGGKYFFGFTIKRSTVLGSTCAERMALDNWFQDKEKPKPVKLILTGMISRNGWKDCHICYPCGSCRELYHQFIHSNDLKNFYFECYSWDLLHSDMKSLRELLYYGKPFYEKK